ncbi:MAG: DUF1540 domain-containing protein [Oxalobacter sp.]|jgi:hypothetical protein|nr:MAG: DUF1540 domain-containing protein [Oxalobacter sp.]
MKRIPIVVDMPTVKGCEVSQCVYNTDAACHAKAITIGDMDQPGCDTFFSASSSHAKSLQQAGVGACKMSDCKFNEDYECAAPEIMVGLQKNSAKCITYAR